jgi:WD40 repeat protein/serine/threonine protein kinase
MAWPLSQDYNEAIQSARVNFADTDLRRGTATVNALGLPMPFSGSFADVYRVECPDGRRWAVKCFTREVPHLRERYQEISRFLRQARLPFTVDFSYLEEGIRVRGRWYPVLKMQWVEGLTFNAFVRQFLDKPRMLEAVLRLWARMAKYLRSSGAAHGDLQHGNILLVPGANANALALKLIDYDGMFVPALAGSKSGEVGHPAYQHPQRLQEGTYGPEVDRFPLLLIATALAALKVKGKSLWDKYDNADNLLFREADLRDPAQSNLLRDLARMNDPTTAALSVALRTALAGDLGATPLLEEVLAGVPIAAPAATSAVMATPALASLGAADVVQPATEGGIWDFSETITEVSVAEAIKPRNKRVRSGEKRAGVPLFVWIGGAAAIAVVLGVLILGAVVIGLISRNFTKKPDPAVPDNNPVALAVQNEPKPPIEEKVPPEPKPEEKVVNEPAPKVGEREKPVFADNEKVGEVRHFDLAIRVQRGPGHVAAITGDGSRLFRAFDKSIRVIRVSDGQTLCQTDQGKSYPLPIAIDPAGRNVALGEYPGSAIDIWSIDDLKNKTTIRCKDKKGQDVATHRLVFSPDGKLLLTCANDSTIHLWDWEQGQEVRVVKQDPVTAHPSCLAFSPDGLNYLIGNMAPKGKASVRVMRVEDSTEIAKFTGHSADVTCVAVAADKQHAVSGAEDKTVRVWDLRTAAEKVVFDKHKTPIAALAVSPDGRWVLSSSEDGDLRLWELGTGREVHRYAENRARAATMGFLADGHHAYTSGADNVVRIWRLPTRDTARTPPPDSKTPTATSVGKNQRQREPVPDAAALAAADAEVMETYKTELAKRERLDLLKLSNQLSVEGTNAKNKRAAIRYVLLWEARDLAAKAGDFRLAMIKAEGMAEIFAVDAWEMKADALEQADSKSYNMPFTRDARELAVKSYYRNAAMHALVTADAAIEHDALGAAERMVKAAQKYETAARDANLTAVIPARLKELAALLKAFEKVPDAQKTLESRSEDPDANLVVGKYFALGKGDWDKGVRFLSRGNDARLRDLAKRDLECALNADAMTELGDKYAAHAETEEDAAKTHTLWRASYWYERAEGMSQAPERTKIAAKRSVLEKMLPASRPVVLFARYGAAPSWVDATENLRRFLLSPNAKLAFPNGVCTTLDLPDPAFGQQKTLILVYRHRGRVRVSTTGDADAIQFPAPNGFVDAQPGTPAPSQELAILCARYGAVGTYSDATAKCQQAVKDETLAVKLADLDLGDPIFGKRKWLILVYRHEGTVFLSIIVQEDAIRINTEQP